MSDCSEIHGEINKKSEDFEQNFGVDDPLIATFYIHIYPLPKLTSYYLTSGLSQH